MNRPFDVLAGALHATCPYITGMMKSVGPPIVRMKNAGRTPSCVTETADVLSRDAGRTAAIAQTSTLAPPA